MDQEKSKAHLRALGARVLSEANDLKRTPEALAREIGFEPAVIGAVIAGEAEEQVVHQVLGAMAARYPVALSDLLVVADDTDEGVHVMSAADSETSARIIARPDRTGARQPYYEYRDTAMSRNAPFRPEWIKQLRNVQNAEPTNPDVAYNHGHLLHQFTFFVGPVNFYWEVGGRRYCAELDSGDSSYIVPLVPHSFAARDPRREAIIVAVAYSAHLRRAAADLLHLDGDVVAELAGDLRRPETVFQARLRRHLDAESLSPEQLERRLVEKGLDPMQAAAVVERGPSCDQELHAMAGVLNVRTADLAADQLLPHEEVVVQRRHQATTHGYPDAKQPAYRLTALARTRHQPFLKGFDMEILGGGDGTLRHSLHEYVYNHGATAVRLEWGAQREAIIEPRGSAYIRPFVSHRFAIERSSAPGRLLSVRVPGLLVQDVVTELASLDPRGRARATAESMIWF